MAEVGFAEEDVGLVKYQVGYANGAMYVQLTDDAWIEHKPFKLGGKLHPVGSEFTKLGTKPRRTFSMMPGHYLKYEGRVENVLLFSSDGEVEDGFYYGFYVVGDRLLLGGPNGMSDIW